MHAVEEDGLDSRLVPLRNMKTIFSQAQAMALEVGVEAEDGDRLDLTWSSPLLSQCLESHLAAELRPLQGTSLANLPPLLIHMVAGEDAQ